MSLPALLAAVLLSVSPPPSDEEGPHPAMPSAAFGGSLTLTELKTPRFRIITTERAKGAAELLATEIEARRDAIQRGLGRDWPGITEVRVGYGREEFEALSLPDGRPPSWAVALAYPTHNILLVEAHSLTLPDGQETLRHELVHVALGQLGRGWPHWFQEGMAQDITLERRYQLSLFTTLTRAVASGRVYHFDELANGFPARADDVEIAYAQSEAFVAFLRGRHSDAQFLELLENVGRGDGFEVAFAKALHTSIGAEEEVFRKQLPLIYPWWTVIISGSLLWVVGALLLVVAYVRRRRAMARWHQRQAEQERLEDAALSLLQQHLAANDDGQWETQSLGWPPPGPPWRVSIAPPLNDEADAQSKKPA